MCHMWHMRCYLRKPALGHHASPEGGGAPWHIGVQMSEIGFNNTPT